MVRNFLSVENSVDHVAAKKSHFDLVSSVWVDFVILVDGLKDVGGCWSVWKFQVVESSLVDYLLVSFIEVFNRHVVEH